MLIFCLQNPQVVTGSHDTTIKMWDLRYGNLWLYFSYLLACLCSDYMHNLTHDAFIFIQVKQCQLLQTIKNLYTIY